MSKRFRDHAYSDSALKKKNALSPSIYSLSASQSNANIPPRKLSRHEDFVHRIHRLLSRSRSTNAYEFQCNKYEVQEKGSILELKNQIEILSRRVEKLEGRNKCGSNILERTSVPFPEMKLIGREYEENAAKILGWLKNPDASTIGVWGMPGVGKTALLKHICNLLIQDVSFSANVYWLTVSDCDDSVYKWQASIATCFGFDLSNVKDGVKRKCMLRTELAKRGNIVLILDDMWHPFRRDEVGIPAGVNGFKIILTTSSLQVCRRMKCGDFTIKVDCLWFGYSLSLFVAELKDYDKLSEEVKDVAKKIVAKCYGLPLAIITMVFRLTGEVDINEWKSVLGELGTFEQIDMKDKVLSKLQKSYDSLNHEIQMCFLSSVFYIATVLKYPISRSDVINCWIEEGLLGETGNSEERLRKGNTILNRLTELALLDGDIGDPDIGLDNLIRAMAIHVAKENQCRMNLNSYDRAREVLHEALWSEDLVRATFSYQRKNIPDVMSPNFPKLTVLDLGNNPLIEIPESFFAHMKALTVLNLSGTRIKRLPNSVCNLENLRTLKLAYCEKLVHAPSLTNLLKLKVLDLEETTNVEGHMGIEDLIFLEKLNFTWKSDWSHFSSTFRWKSDWSHFNSLMESWPFSSMLQYKFFLHSCETGGMEDMEDDELMSHSEYDRVMNMMNVDFKEEKILKLPGEVEFLQLYDCDITNLVDALPSSGDAIKLKSVYLRYCKGLEYIFSATEEVPFTSPHLNTLADLCIQWLDDLRGLIKLDDLEISQEATVFPGLKHLSIHGCSELRNLLMVKSVRQSLHCFSDLETLSLEECGELQDFIVHSMNEDVNREHISNPVFPNLRDLKLDSLPKLGSTVCRGLLYTSLRKISIRSCAKIKEVFGLDLVQQSQPLPNLEILEVSGCGNLEMIFSSSKNSSPNPILVLPKLKILKLENLPKLVCIYRGVLLCDPIDKGIDICCPKVEGLSNAVICDKSQSTLVSLPNYDSKEVWWEPLKGFPKDARVLSDRADECRRLEQYRGPSSSTLNAYQMPWDLDDVDMYMK